MKIEDIIKNAGEQSLNGTRRGDTEEEIIFIQDYLKSARKIIIPTGNKEKVKGINHTGSQRLPRQSWQLTSANVMWQLPGAVWVFQVPVPCWL